jgi:hypothetical protein
MKYLFKVSVLAIGLLIFSSVVGQGQITEPQSMEVIPDHLVYLYAPEKSSKDRDVQYQLYAERRRWENGRRLRACFYNGNPVVVKLVRIVASEWNSYSGVVIDFGPEGGWLNCLHPQAGFPEIRIGFSV